MTKTKSKKDKNAGAAAKIARKTIGLVVRVGDALEAAVAAASPAPVAPSTPAVAPPAPPASQSRPLQEARATENGPGAPGDVALVDVREVASGDVRALAAIEAYAIQHNLEAVDMPSRDMLIGALLGGMARHGSELTDDQVRSLIDEQMRIHFRALAARATAPASVPTV